LARAVLNAELTPLLPPEWREEARLIAAAMAIAEREAAEADGAFAAILRELAAFYADFRGNPLPHRAPGSSPGQALQARSPLSRTAGEAGEGEAGATSLLKRFAGDLRRGVFEASPARERAARDLLWHLARARLRRSNPQFLAAHGFA
jgi:hypothetical protein